MLSKDFEIFYYSDRGMAPVELHTHNYYEFYFLLGGDVSIEIMGRSFPLKSGDVMLIPPSTVHRPIIHDSEVPYQRLVFWISQEYCNQLLQLSTDYVYPMQHVAINKQYIYHFDSIVFNELLSKAFALISELQANRFGKSARVSLYVNDLILTISTRIYEKENPSLITEKHSLYQNLMTYIDNHIDEDLSLDTLSNEFFVSKYHIAHVFKENLGISIHQYILKKRLAITKDAILSQSDISEAYLQCGFNDYSSFYRAFKKEYGKSPKEFYDEAKALITKQN